MCDLNSVVVLTSDVQLCTNKGPFINYVTLKGISASVTMYALSIHQYVIMCDEGGGVHNGQK